MDEAAVTEVLNETEARIYLLANGSKAQIAQALGEAFSRFLLASLELGIDPLTMHERFLRNVDEFFQPARD